MMDIVAKTNLVLLFLVLWCVLGGTLTAGGAFDNTNGNGLAHIANGETAKRGVVGEGFDAHWLLWDHTNDTGITLFQEFWVFFQNFTGTTVHL